MSNFSLEQLLQMDPYEALLIAYNEEHGTQFNPRYVVLDAIVGSDGPQLTVRLKARADLPNKDDQRFSGTCTITVNRLNLADFFVDPFVIPYDTNITSLDVGNTINARTGIVFDENDFIRTIVTPESDMVEASPSSLRWYGQLIVAQA